MWETSAISKEAFVEVINAHEVENRAKGVIY